jgi:excisionase family DNA binding protein
MTASADERRYRVAELAKLWNVDKSTVYRMIYSGRLHAERHGEHGKAIRVTAVAVAEYLSGVLA